MSTLPFQPTPLAIPQVIAVLVSAGFAARVWSQRHGTSGARELVLTQVFNIIWALMGALEFCASTIPAKILCSQLSYIGVVGAPWAGFRFAWVYTGAQRPLPRWFYVLTTMWGGLVLALVFTNGYHHLVWSDVVPVEIHGDFFARYDRGPGFWLNITLGYGLTLASCALFVRHAIDFGGIYRGQSLITVLAISCPWLTSLAYLFRIGPLPEIDNTPVGFAFGNALFTWNLTRWRFLDLAPVATRTLFERMSEPVLVIDGRERLSQANRAATEIFQLPDRVGIPFSEAFAAHPAILDACLNAPDPAPPQAVADEDGRWWNIELTTLSSRRGVRYGRLCVLHDITALVEARKAAELAAHAKAEFLSHVSHDLRTPLHSILVISEILQSGQITPEQRAQLATLRQAGQALLRLVDNLLDMNRLESGFIDLADTPFLLEDVLVPVSEILRVSAHRKGLELVHEIEPGWNGALRGDPDRLRQILFNLGGNAVKFTERGRVVLRASRPEPAMLRIEIIDTGPGLPPGQAASLFDPFVRGEHDSAKEGSGLGLSIVRRLAEAMGGSASAANRTGPERGSVFTVDLPIIDTAPAPPTRPPDVADASAPALVGGLRALIVDDDPRSLAAGTALLIHCGCTVQTASSGEAALAMLDAAPSDLVVMDGQMPGMDGIEVTRRIRAFPAGHPNHGVVVLGFTADPSPLRHAQWTAAGASAILGKPSTIAEFSAALTRLAASRSG